MAARAAGPAERIAVHSQHNDHRAYLEIVRDGTSIRVQPTLLGKKKLNRFWTMWLRKLLLEQTPAKRGYAIEIRRNNLRITSDASIDAMIGTVHQIAAQLYLLPEPPLVRHRFDSEKNARDMRIAIKAKPQSIPDEAIAAMDWPAIVEGIKLPEGAYLKLSGLGDSRAYGYGDLWLYYPLRHKRNLTATQIYMLLELEVALLCHP